MLRILHVGTLPVEDKPDTRAAMTASLSSRTTHLRRVDAIVSHDTESCVNACNCGGDKNPTAQAHDREHHTGPKRDYVQEDDPDQQGAAARSGRTGNAEAAASAEEHLNANGDQRACQEEQPRPLETGSGTYNQQRRSKPLRWSAPPGFSRHPIPDTPAIVPDDIERIPRGRMATLILKITFHGVE